MRSLLLSLVVLAACGGPSNTSPDAGTGGGTGGNTGGGGGTGGGAGGGVGGGAGGGTGGNTGSTTNTASLYCNHSASVAVPGLSNLTSTVSFTCSATTRTMTSNGLPDHAPGTFPNPDCPNAISAQQVTQATSLSPVVDATSTAKEPGHLINGVKLDPGTAESYQNAGTWRIEALQTYRGLGLDDSNAHVQPTGSYHYHGMPEGFLTTLGKGQAMTFVGFAVDGFPIYARYGHSDALDGSSAIVKLTPSYRLKSAGDSGRPSTTEVPLGTFTQDWEYVAGLGQLDECNGRFGVTPEFPNGTYHYYITEAYPFIQRCVKGKVAAGTNTGGGPGGGTGGGTGPGPKSCTTSADCTNACPPGSVGCTCGNSPQGMICIPTCTTSADCPASPTGGQMTCNQGSCRP